MSKRILRKRPCRICRKWFLPNPHVKEKQQTCGRAECRRELHSRACAAWHKRNPDYNGETRLKLRLHDGGKTAAASEPFRSLSREEAKKAVGMKCLVVIEEACKTIMDLAMIAAAAGAGEPAAGGTGGGWTRPTNRAEA